MWPNLKVDLAKNITAITPKGIYASATANANISMTVAPITRLSAQMLHARIMVALQSQTSFAFAIAHANAGGIVAMISGKRVVTTPAQALVLVHLMAQLALPRTRRPGNSISPPGARQTPLQSATRPGKVSMQLPHALSQKVQGVREVGKPLLGLPARTPTVVGWACCTQCL